MKSTSWNHIVLENSNHMLLEKTKNPLDFFYFTHFTNLSFHSFFSKFDQIKIPRIVWKVLILVKSSGPNRHYVSRGLTIRWLGFILPQTVQIKIMLQHNKFMVLFFISGEYWHLDLAWQVLCIFTCVIRKKFAFVFYLRLFFISTIWSETLWKTTI